MEPNGGTSNETAQQNEVSVQPGPRKTRRWVLGAAGAGAGAAAMGVTAGTAMAQRGSRSGTAGQGRSRRDDGGRRRGGDGRRGNESEELLQPAQAGPAQFSRMFDRNSIDRRELEPMQMALIELSRPGGILDANDPVEVGPIRLITEPDLSPGNLDNPTHTAGTTFVGQFLDHDITRDAGSTLGRPTSINRSTNLRSARFDLDSVYGGGPAESPDLYSDDGTRLRVESGGQFEDLPRDGAGKAIIADPRNDENLMLSGLQVAMLKFHNAVMDRVEASGLRGDAAMAEAQRLVRWHYQWMILSEYLPQIVGLDTVVDVMTNGRRFYRSATPTIPVEFQTAAYRFGHSMVRPSYRANLAGDNGEAFFAMIFDADQFGQPDPNDLTGGHRAARRFIDWQTFFDFEDGEVKPNKRIDTAISTPLFRLPTGTIDVARGEDVGPTSLATRNLLRHLTWEIATGQQVARAMGVPALTQNELSPFGDFGGNLDRATPLWLYSLREAEIAADGLHLGPVAGRIVAEVFIGILEMDNSSFLSAQPDWRPTLPTRNGGNDFRMVDLLTVAGVDPDARAAA